MTHSPDPEPSPATQPAVEVDVARSGGFAGITRRWSAQPAGDEASEWIALIDRCPWDEVGAHDAPRAPVPDGFTWSIRVTWSDADPREARLVDDEVVGAWRELVDAVRDWSRRSGGGREVSGRRTPSSPRPA
ncbi:hypothetical protein JNB62_08845 [Microbacterium jejuense]|uniref:Uncharacterized protein n=1 Tax=Microbacterium jejuense TaxID=1263637 RepID=A0ABS7HLH3_9MICO|nr:protealysin inhibitor emfourin [Microbacterium jejuense]MBW9093787.1 hypothetical protein [Microbacterium jejuense]